MRQIAAIALLDASAEASLMKPWLDSLLPQGRAQLMAAASNLVELQSQHER